MKIALITGAAGGLGKQICRTLATDGFHIIALDLHKTETLRNKLADVSNNLIQTIGGVDFNNPASVMDSLNPLLPNKYWTVLVNNAGVSTGGNLLDSTLEEWNLMINVNLSAPFILSQAFVKNSQHHNIKGSIINISSMVGIIGGKKPGYAASKAGLLGLTKSIAMQAGPSVRCNAIYPGAINTPMTADWNKEKKSKIAANTPIGRIAEPTEIANIVAFLANEQKSGFLTGSIINATGGQYLGQ